MSRTLLAALAVGPAAAQPYALEWAELAGLRLAVHDDALAGLATG